MKIRRFNEEIGFSYSGKEGPEEVEEPLKDNVIPFSMDSIERTYKKISMEAFKAGRDTTLTFDQWWSNIWNVGHKVEKPVIKRNKLGFNIPSSVEDSSSDITSDKPRIKPPKPPKRPNTPSPTPIKKPGIRKGIWFEDLKNN